jgi:hypothetical protein
LVQLIGLSPPACPVPSEKMQMFLAMVAPDGVMRRRYRIPAITQS